MKRSLVVIATVIGLVVGPAGLAWGLWSALGSGSASSKATALAAPGAGTFSTTGAQSLGLSWVASTGLPGTGGYTVLRSTDGTTYNPVSSGACYGTSGIVSGTSCTDSGLVPNTHYYYKVKAVLAGWVSATNSPFDTTTTYAPTTTTLSNISPTSGTAGSTSFGATATVTGYGTPSGNVVMGLYTASDCSGSASYSTATLTLDGTGKANGSLTPAAAGTYYWGATYASTDSYNATSAGCNSTTPITVAVAGPAVTSVAVASGTDPEADPSGGYLGSGKKYYVYAAVTGTGITSVAVDASNLTTGSTAVAMTTTGGPWTVGAVSYNYRTANLTAKAGLSGTPSVTVTATSTGTATGSTTVTIDNTAPAVTGLVLANGGTSGTIDSGDSVTVTLSETVNVRNICQTWTSDITDQTLTDVTVVIGDSGGNDNIQSLASTACPTLTAFWSGNSGLQLGADYVGGGGGDSAEFSSSAVTWIAATHQFKVTLGTLTLSNTIRTGKGPAVPAITPSANALFDRAGNALPTSKVNGTSSGF